MPLVTPLRELEAPAFYPDAITPRTPRLPNAVGAGELAVPRARFVAFTHKLVASTRSTISLGPFIGPALVKRLWMSNSNAVAPPAQTLEVAKSTNRITESGVPLTTLRPYTTLTELTDPFGIVAAAAGAGIVLTALSTTEPNFPYDLNLLIQDPTFYLVLALWNNSAGANTAEYGWVTLLEGLDPQNLPGSW